jgi:hypothetical protein
MFLGVQLMVHDLPRMQLIYCQLLPSSLITHRINGCVMISKIGQSDRHIIQFMLITITGICVHGFLKGQWMVQHGQNWIVILMIRPQIRIIRLEHFRSQVNVSVNFSDFVKRVPVRMDVIT